MIMGLPLFLLFAVYSVFNTYLSILLSGLGYSPAMIGVLQGIFEVSGFIFPVFVSSRVDKSGRYGQAMVAFALLMVLVLPPLVLIRNFTVTALTLAVFAIGFKGAVPVADALVSRMLGDNRNEYGRVRVLGSIGFVCMALVLQFTPMVNASEPSSISFWIGVSALAFALSVILSPGLLKVWPAHGHEEAAVKTASAPDEKTALTGFARYKKAMSSFGISYWIGISLIFLGFLGMVPSQRFLSLYVRESLHLESYAGLWALSAAAEVPFMFLSGWFVKKLGTSKILFLSVVAITVRNLIYALVPTFGGAVAGQLLHSVCFGLFHPAAILFVAERAPKRYMVVAMTIYTSVAVGISSALGNILGGFVIQDFGYRTLFFLFAVFPAFGALSFPFIRKRLYRFD